MGDTEGLLCPGGPHRVLLGFSTPLSCDMPQSWGEQVLDKKTTF